MSKYKISVPSARGMGDPDMFDPGVITPNAVTLPNLGSVDGLDSHIRDIVLHAAICRIAYDDNTTVEFPTKYDPATQTIDIDIPDEALDYLMRVEVGPNLERYFSWLTNSVSNLRRDTMQFTIGSSTSIALGMQGIGLTVGYDCYIERADLFLSTTGDLELELRAMPAEDWPGTAAHTLGTISVSGVREIEANISDWDIELRRGDIVVYRVTDVGGGGVQLATMSLYVSRYAMFDSQSST